MDLGLKLILFGGLVLNFLLGFALSSFIVDRLLTPGTGKRASGPSRFLKAALFVAVGTAASVLGFALSIVIIWPPHIW